MTKLELMGQAWGRSTKREDGQQQAVQIPTCYFTLNGDWVESQE